MPDYVLTTIPDFPDGTTVGAYLARSQASSSSGPLGSPVDEQVATDGEVTFTGLTTGESYFAFGLVNDEWRRIQFHINVPPHTPLFTDSDETITGDYAFEGETDFSEATAVLGLTAAMLNGGDAAAVLATLFGANPNLFVVTGAVDGTAKSVSAAQTAYDSAVAAGGGIVLFPPGVHYFSDASSGAVIKLTRDNDTSRGKVLIRGPGATIKLSADTPRFIDFNKVADHDIFWNHEICDFQIDANNVSGNHHVVIGTLQNNVVQKRIGVQNLAIRRVRAYNIPTDTTGTNIRRGMWIVCDHAANDEATQDTLARITYEDCRLEGGNYGFTVAGSNGVGFSTNVFVDDIRYIRCFHDTLSTPTAVFSSANFHIGSTGFGGIYRIEGCRGIRAGDVGVEVNAPTEATVSDTVIEDACVAHFFCRNFRAPLLPSGQEIVYKDCFAVDTRIAGGTVAVAGHGFLIGLDNTSSESPFGHVILDKCRHHANGSLTEAMKPGMALQSVGTAINRLTVRDFRFIAPTVTFNPSSSVNPGVVYLAPGTTCRTTIDGFVAKITGGNSGGANLNRLRCFYLQGKQVLDLNRCDIDYAVTGLTAGRFTPLLIGTDAGSTISGRIRALRCVGVTDDTGPIGAIIGGTGTLTISPRLTFEHCDLSALPAGATEFTYQAPTNAANVKRVNHIDRDGAFVLDAW